MRDIDLLQQALGLEDPWLVESVTFDPETKRLDIRINFRKGAVFDCPACDVSGCKVHDSKEKTRRHLNFFQHEAYITARVPRAGCSDCGPHLVDVPWARLGSGFTLLFEAMIMTLAKQMPVRAIASFVGEHDTRLWRILHHYVDKAREEADYSQVKRVGVDETSRSKGHNYVTLFADMDDSRVLMATEGKGASTIEDFKADLIDHKGSPDQIKEMCSDRFPAFISGIEKHFPEASVTFDKFHIMKTSRAYHIRLNFQQLFDQPVEQSEAYLKKWYFWATHSRLEPIKQAAYTIKRHWDGVLRWFKSRITNGLLEGLNSLIQAAKARARGYRTTRNLITMIYIIAGKLQFDLPT